MQDATDSSVTCRYCGSRNYEVVEQRFRGGDVHKRVQCGDCGKFIKWGDKSSRNKRKREFGYPGDASEFEVQSFLFWSLKQLGYDVRGEVRSKFGRFDLVIYDSNRDPTRIIEVKKWTHEALRTSKKRCRDIPRQRLQIIRYERAGVPVDLVAGMKNARKYVGMVTNCGLPETPVRLGHRSRSTSPLAS